MHNLWNNDHINKFVDDLDWRVYTSRLLGQDPSLVLHGRGNTSVKILETSLVGKEEEILYVKGSGWDLISIEKEGFAPVRKLSVPTPNGKYKDLCLNQINEYLS